MSGWKDWQIGEVVTEGDFQSLVQDQVVQRYADASARSSTLGTAVAEGMVSYLDDTNRVEVYDGTAWTDFSGDITGVTAGTGLSGGGTAGDVTLSADYAAIGSAITIETSQVSDLTASASALNTIDDGTQGFTALSNGTAGITYQPVSPNYIINGGFDVWQRGTSFALTGDAYTADRWFVDNRGGTITITQEDFTPAEVSATGFGEGRYYAKIAYDASNTNGRFDQPVEDVRTLAGQTATLSFWAKSADSITLSAQAIQSFGSGGSAGVTTGISDSVTLTTSWVRYSITGTINSISGKTVGAGSYLLTRFFSTATAAEFDLWGVQLEAGSVATPFKRNAPSLQGELAACQRYCQVYDATSQGGLATMFVALTTRAQGAFSFPVMRAAPTAIFSASNTFEFIHEATATTLSSGPSFNNTTTTHTRIVGDVASGLTVGNAAMLRFVGGAGGSITLSAEL